MSSIQLLNPSLRQETQSLVKLHHNYLIIKGLFLDTLTNFASWSEALMLGTRSPALAVLFKVGKLCSSLGLSQLFTQSMTGLGLRTVAGGTVSLTVGGREANQPLIRTLQANAKKMNLNINGVGGGTLGIVIGDEMGTSSVSMLDEKVIRCPSILYVAPETIKQTAPFISDPQDRASILALTQNPAYPAFLGTQVLAQIQMNSRLIHAAVEMASLFSAKSLIRLLAERWGMNTAGLSYIALIGLLSKFAADCAGIICSRYLCYQADKKAIEVTEDVKSAVEALKIMETLEPSFKEKLSLFFGMVFNSESCKNQLSVPSAESRILALDPQARYAGFAIPAAAPDEKSEIERLTLQKALYENALQDFFALRSNVNASFALAASGALSLLNMLVRGYLIRDPSGSSIRLALQAGCILMMNLYPHQIENVKCYIKDRLGIDISASDPASYAQQDSVRAIAQEMGIQKRVEVRTLTNADGISYATLGIARGPGAIVVFVPPAGKYTKDQEEATLRHEFSHNLKWDMLISALLTLGMIGGLNRLVNSLGFNALTHVQKLKQGILIYTSACAMQKVFNRYLESRADANSVHSCPSEKKEKQIEDLSAVLKNTRQQNLAILDQVAGAPWIVRFVMGLFISSTGENYLDLDHPLVDRRIQDLQSMKPLR